MDRILRATVLLLLSASVFAQNVQLTLEQQLMLNQLPPAQRQQAMDALRQLNAQQRQSQQTINETIGEFTELAEQDREEEPEEPRAEARSRIVIGFEMPEELSIAEEREFEEDPIIQRLVGSHLYILDDDGVLTLEGLSAIPLLGLTEDEITRRLEAESYLARFAIDARILAQEPIGVEALEPFGYDVFEPRDVSLQPPTRTWSA